MSKDSSQFELSYILQELLSWVFKKWGRIQDKHTADELRVSPARALVMGPTMPLVF